MSERKSLLVDEWEKFTSWVIHKKWKRRESNSWVVQEVREDKLLLGCCSRSKREEKVTLDWWVMSEKIKSLLIEEWESDFWVIQEVREEKVTLDW